MKLSDIQPGDENKYICVIPTKLSDIRPRDERIRKMWQKKDRLWKIYDVIVGCVITFSLILLTLGIYLIIKTFK